jgi:hypothetical protein
MKQLVTFALLFFCLSASSQNAVCKPTDKEEFMGVWIFFEIRNSANKKIPGEVEKKTMIFNKDSVFIITNEKYHRGTWTFDSEQIQINIANDPAFNYKWTIKNSNFVCFRLGDNTSRLECFKKEK